LCEINLPDDDPKKITSSTPKRFSSSICSIWQGDPQSKIIVQDCKKVMHDSMPAACAEKLLLSHESAIDAERDVSRPLRSQLIGAEHERDP